MRDTHETIRTSVDRLLSYVNGKQLLFATTLRIPIVVVPPDDQNITDMENVVSIALAFRV